MPFVKVLRHGQVTVPKSLRKILGIEEGDVLEVVAENNGVLFKPKILLDKKTQRGGKQLATAKVAKEETAKEKEWSALAATSFIKDWENEKDAIYDNWEEQYHISKG
jgi:AbrB family looped-hinge helix DNA binding protein